MFERIRSLFRRRTASSASQAPQTAVLPPDTAPAVVDRKIRRADLDPDAVKIVQRLTRYRHKAYLVGGKCVNGEYDVICKGVQEYRWHYYEPTIGRCTCGREVVLDDGLENPCECGILYNMSGQRLNPNWRRDVYEETGELL